MKTIRCGRGLGDSIYLQSVVRHLHAQDKARYRVCSDFPDVFRPLGNAVSVTPFTRQGVNIVAHYVQRKPLAGSTQFQDCCAQAGITTPVELRLDWALTDHALPRELRQRSPLPIVCVQLPRAPMGRTDGFGAELLPDCRVIQRAIDALHGRALIV